MVLKINLGRKREKRLMRHLEKEHPSVRGKIKMSMEQCKRMFKVPEGIPLEAFENMTIGEIKKLNADYKKLIKGGKK